MEHAACTSASATADTARPSIIATSSPASACREVRPSRLRFSPLVVELLVKNQSLRSTTTTQRGAAWGRPSARAVAIHAVRLDATKSKTHSHGSSDSEGGVNVGDDECAHLAPDGSTRAWRHGAYSGRFMSERQAEIVAELTVSHANPAQSPGRARDSGADRSGRARGRGPRWRREQEGRATRAAWASTASECAASSAVRE
jgi:hypothetical protein